MKTFLGIYIIVALIGLVWTRLAFSSHHDIEHEFMYEVLMFVWPISLPILCIIWLKKRNKWTTTKKN